MKSKERKGKGKVHNDFFIYYVVRFLKNQAEGGLNYFFDPHPVFLSTHTKTNLSKKKKKKICVLFFVPPGLFFTIFCPAREEGSR